MSEDLNNNYLEMKVSEPEKLANSCTGSVLDESEFFEYKYSDTLPPDDGSPMVKRIKIDSENYFEHLLNILSKAKKYD